MRRADPDYAARWYGASSYFNATYHGGFAAAKPLRYYFVAGARYDDSEPQRYSVHLFDPRTRRVSTVSDFNAYATVAAALDAAKRLASGETLE